jgi:hypothetical protein
MFSRRDATYASLAYRYHNPDWDSVRNREVYGDDHSAVGIGANMTIWLEVEGELERHFHFLIPENGLAPHLQYAKQLLDHRCLFEAEPWFQKRVPTLENIARFLEESVGRRPLVRGKWRRLTLEENEHWRVDVLAGQCQLIHTFEKNGWKIEATVAGPVDAESGLLLERNRFRAAIERSPWTGHRSFFLDLKSHLPQLIGMRARAPLPTTESHEIACLKS